MSSRATPTRPPPAATRSTTATVSTTAASSSRSQTRATALSGSSRSTWRAPSAVVEVDHAVGETAFVQQFELQADVVEKRVCAASDHDGREEKMAFVDQPDPERLGGEVGTAHADITPRLPPSSAGPLQGRRLARSASWHSTRCSGADQSKLP